MNKRQKRDVKKKAADEIAAKLAAANELADALREDLNDRSEPTRLSLRTLRALENYEICGYVGEGHT